MVLLKLVAAPLALSGSVFDGGRFKEKKHKTITRL